MICHVDQLLNLDNLLIQIQGEVNPLWYQFGEALGVKKEILNSYTRCSPDVSIIEMLDYWLRNHEGQPAWKEVAVALKRIGLQKLGSDLERVYETGTDKFILFHANLSFSIMAQESFLLN